MLALPAATVPAAFATTSLPSLGDRGLRATRAAWYVSFSPTAAGARPIPLHPWCLPRFTTIFTDYTKATKRAASLATTLHLQRSVDGAVRQGADGTTVLPAICSRQTKCQKYPVLCRSIRVAPLCHLTISDPHACNLYAQRLWTKLSIIDHSYADMRRSYKAFAREILQRKKKKISSHVVASLAAAQRHKPCFAAILLIMSRLAQICPRGRWIPCTCSHSQWTQNELGTIQHSEIEIAKLATISRRSSMP